MKSYVFTVVVEDDEREDGRKAYRVHCPEIEEALTWGGTRAEAMQRINELLSALVQMRLEKGQPIPSSIELDCSVVAVTV